MTGRSVGGAGKPKGVRVIEVTEKERMLLAKLRDAPRPVQLKVIKALQQLLTLQKAKNGTRLRRGVWR